MTYLSESDNELIQSYLGKAVAVLKLMGLQLEVRRDLQDCVSAYYDTPGHIKYPTTHHPDHVWCHPDNSFWVSFDCAKSGRHAVVAAHRVIHTQSIVSELYTHRAFQDLSPVIDAYDIGLQNGLPRLSGSIPVIAG